MSWQKDIVAAAKLTCNFKTIKTKCFFWQVRKNAFATVQNKWLG